MDVLVVVLDGLSYVFSNTFLWWNKDIERLFKYPGARRRMMYVDVLPETPSVMGAFFTLRKFVEGGTIEWVWEIRRDKRIKAINIPVRVPPVYYGVTRPRDWVDYFTPPREIFLDKLMEYHSFVKRQGHGDALLVWYPVPDQAHHHFFPTINNMDSLSTALYWYGLACRLAVELIEYFKPRRWLIVGDHGFTSDVQEAPVKARFHIRESTAITNYGEPPMKASEVVYWIIRALDTR